MLKTCKPIAICGQRGRQDLDSDLTLQFGIGGPIGIPHPPRTQVGGDGIRAETGTGREGHCVRDCMGETSTPRGSLVSKRITMEEPPVGDRFRRLLPRTHSAWSTPLHLNIPDIPTSRHPYIPRFAVRHSSHGFTTGTSSPSKCLVFLVASNRSRVRDWRGLP